MTRVPAARVEPDRAVDSAARVPGFVTDVEMSLPLAGISARHADGRLRERVWLLVRVFNEPVGLVTVAIPADGLGPDQLAAAVDDAVGTRIRARALAAGATLPAVLPSGGFTTARIPDFLAEREKVLANAEPITVVVCTRNRPDVLARCLNALLAQEYPQLRILVVDNAPCSGGARQVAASAAASGIVSYVVEPRPGLSRARNRGVRAASTDLVAFIDDDEVADPYWLAELARAFRRHPEAGAVTGVIVPAELETPAQVMFEEFGGHSKGRGFEPAVFSPASAHLQSPLYPLPPFGAGGNMVFRRTVLESLGGFDNALGAGTPAKGAEDTMAFTRVLLGGGTIVYQPSAVVRHQHYRDFSGLSNQMHGYGVGLTAFYTGLVLSDPKLLVRLARLARTAARDMVGRDSRRSGRLAAQFPPELLARNRRGMLTGPWAYLRSRRQERRSAAGHGNR
jgi:GT2 family glycosyltransferase